MDENKDFLTSEQEAENNMNSDTDTKTNENSQEGFSGAFSEEIAETQGDSESEVSPVDYSANTPVAVKKKKGFVQLPVIISLAILVLVALGFLVFKLFFNTSVVGTWTVKDTATADEATTATADEVAKNYYSFEDDGTASIHLGTMKMIGTYSLDTSDEGTRTIIISIPSALEGTFEYEVTGNEITGRTLTLTDTYYGQSIDLESTKLVIPDMKPDADFKPSDKLSAKWTYDDGYYKMRYELREDGTATVSQSDILFADGVYNYTDSTITIKYYTNQEVTMELNYELKDDSIIIDGIQFTKDTGSSSDES
ncbi:MAG: DUF5640 domain-containing protein [Ruminococcus sp.]